MVVGVDPGHCHVEQLLAVSLLIRSAHAAITGAVIQRLCPCTVSRHALQLCGQLLLDTLQEVPQVQTLGELPTDLKPCLQHLNAQVRMYVSSKLRQLVTGYCPIRPWEFSSTVTGILWYVSTGYSGIGWFGTYHNKISSTSATHIVQWNPCYPLFTYNGHCISRPPLYSSQPKVVYSVHSKGPASRSPPATFGGPQ